jgi:hypothetical protein
MTKDVEVLHQTIEGLRAELETAKAFHDVAVAERNMAQVSVTALRLELEELTRHISRRNRAIQAALATWCPRHPGGDGADGETYELCHRALRGEGR